MKKLNLLVLSGIFFSKESIYFENKIKFENQEKGLWEVFKDGLVSVSGFYSIQSIVRRNVFDTFFQSIGPHADPPYFHFNPNTIQ